MAYSEAELSKFRFKNPKVISWHFIVNNDFSFEDYSTTEIKYKISVLKSEDQNVATVALDLQLGEESDKAPFYINAKISSEFTWGDELNSNINRFLNENAVSLLISYLRPMISQFTTYAGFAPLNLPYLDIRQKEILKENEKSKN